MHNNITFKELSSIGFSNYSLTIDGTLYYNFPSPIVIKQDKSNRFTMTSDAGERKRISLKRLYRLSFQKEYCIDSIINLCNE